MQTLLVLIPIFGYVLTLSLLPVVLLTKKKEPTSTVAWIMTISIIPYLGALLFVVFGINRVRSRVLKRQKASRSVNRLLPEFSSHLLGPEHLVPLQRDLLYVAERVGGTRMTMGNHIQVLTDASETFNEIESAIRSAKSSVHLEYYIWQPDRLGTEIRDLLITKAREGVTIRFIYDAIGSARLTHRFLKPMRDAGIRVATFVPGQSLRERWSVNLRSHRKIVIVDGTIGFTGGMNVGDEYLGRDSFFGLWRDTHLRLEGPTVLQLQDIFLTDWNFATGEELSPVDFPAIEKQGGELAQVIASGPDMQDFPMHAMMFAAINRAQHRVSLSTSYFVPTPPLVSALEAAALRGVKTRVILSGPKTYWATRNAARAYYDSLLAAGVEIYEYQIGQFHPKVLTIDGCWSLVGTANFDTRSLYLNFEVGVILYDHHLGEQLEHHFDRDILNSSAINQETWNNRSFRQQIIENFCKMFSPVL